MMIIPDWSDYYPDITQENNIIQHAYRYLASRWNDGKYVSLGDVNSKSSYIFYYLYQLNDLFYQNKNNQSLQNVSNKYQSLIKIYGRAFPKIFDYCFIWMLQMCKEINNIDIQGQWVQMCLDCPEYWSSSNMAVSLLGTALYARSENYVPVKYFPEVFNISSYLSSFGKQLEDEVSEYLVQKLETDFQHSRCNFICKFTSVESFNVAVPCTIDTDDLGGPIYNGVLIRVDHDKLKTFIRAAENEWRSNNNLPRIGAGWVSETRLFEQLKGTFNDQNVDSHVRPNFLGRQHYDIFFPDYKIAVEYQGDQHFRPIDYFGGEQTYKARIERDERKKLISEKNGVHLIYVLPDYDLQSLVVEISNLMHIRVPQLIELGNKSLPSLGQLKKYMKKPK